MIRPIDAELAAMSVLVPAIDIDDPIGAREVDRVIAAEVQGSLDRSGVEVVDEIVEGRDGHPVPVRVYSPITASTAAPVLMLLHGGCFVIGGLHSEDARCHSFVRKTGVSIVAVDYRLSPEHRYPAAIQDCRGVLAWIRSDGRFDASRMGVGGISAGGGLATVLALEDAHVHPLRLLMLLYPVLDGRASSPSISQFPGNPVLDSATVHKMWRAYLGPEWRAGEQSLPPTASPTHAPSVRMLPPTFMAVAELDPLRDDAFAFAERLGREGVDVTFRYYPRAFHSFDSFVATRLAKDAIEHQVAAIRETLG